MRKKIEKAIVEGNFVRKSIKYVVRIIKKLYKKIITKLDLILTSPARQRYAKKFAIENNRLVITAVDGKYSCNPKYIVEEILRRDLPIDIIWLTEKKSLKNRHLFPESIKVVPKFSVEAIEAVASSKIWIENELKFLKPYYVHKKKEQYYIQTWHGSLGFKKIGRANQANHKGRKKRLIKKVVKLCNKTTDYCITNSTWESDVFREAYWDNAEILMYGHCRNDILINQTEHDTKAIKEKVLKFCKIIPENILFEDMTDLQKETYNEYMNANYILYAPTYRIGLSFENYQIDFEKLLESATKRFGGKWKILLRYHLHNQSAGKKVSGNENIINVTTYQDMQELMSISDMGISDYSSWLCDFVLTKRPTFIYATDYADYSQQRGFYYPLSETPFPICQNNDELQNAILNFSNEEYVRDCELFLKDKGCIEDGHAAEKVVDKIVELMGLTDE